MTDSNPDEQWRSIPGWEGLYEVSDMGRVRSVDRSVVRNGGRWSSEPASMTITGRVLAAGVGTGGYLAVSLCRDGRPATHLVHRLVLQTFVGPCPDGMEGCHGPGGQLDNRLANLRWDTRSENGFDRVRHGTHPRAQQIDCKRGHELSGANVLREPKKRGQRGCLACSLALRRWHGLGTYEQAVSDRDRWLQTVADRFYAEIRAGRRRQGHRRRIDDRRCEALYLQGLSTVAIGAELGFDPSTVADALRRAGVPRRLRGRPSRAGH